MTSPTATKTPEFALTIFEQLGGFGRLRAFVDATQFVFCDQQQRWIKFRFKGSDKANLLKVSLEPDDTYSLEFWNIPNFPALEEADFDWLDLGDRTVLNTPLEPTLVEQQSLVYCDQLIDCFESTTGLFLSFSPRP